MKYFITSDVHGFYDELIKALDMAGFDKNNSEHTLVVLGDLLDRGPKSIECLEFVNNLERKILIRGNHEDLLEECLNRGCFRSHDIHNGTNQTVLALFKDADPDSELSALDIEFWLKARRNEKLRTYLDNLVDYYEVGDNIFVHGWIPITYEYDMRNVSSELPQLYWPEVPAYNPNWRTTIWEDDWKDARWYCGYKMWIKGIKEPNKIIWCGHWSSSDAHYVLEDKENDHSPFKAEDIVCMDATTVVSHQVNVEVLEIN